MKKLIKSLRNCAPDRKDYKIMWNIYAGIDRDFYIFFLLPTIQFQPWTYRYNGTSIITLSWLNMHIGIGEWTRVQ